MPTPALHFEIVRTRIPRRQRWHWRIRAANGRILASSETYANEADCRAAIAVVRDGAATAPTLEPRRLYP